MQTRHTAPIPHYSQEEAQAWCRENGVTPNLESAITAALRLMWGRELKAVQLWRDAAGPKAGHGEDSDKLIALGYALGWGLPTGEKFLDLA